MSMLFRTFDVNENWVPNFRSHVGSSHLAQAILAQGLVQQDGYETPHATAFVVKLLLLAAILVATSAFEASRDVLVLLLYVGLCQLCEVRGQVVAPRRSLGSALRLRLV